MSELYGAPSGIDAALKTQREDFHVGVSALETLGKIAQQPADLDLKQAHARYYRGLAGEREAKAADLAALQQLESATVQARAGGVDLNSEQARQLLAPKDDSLASPIERMLQLGNVRGISPRLTAPLALKAAQIRHQEASTLSAQAEAQVRAIDAETKTAERNGSLAQAALASPQGYAQVRMLLASEGRDMQEWPQSWEEARPRLEAIRDSSMKAKDKLTLDRQTLRDEAQKKRWSAQNAVAAATVKLRGAQYDKVNEQYQILKKNGGEASPEVVALRKERRDASIARRDALDRKEFPPAPLDPAAREPEKTYTAANGTRFKWTTDPTTGKYAAMVLAAKPGKISAADETDDGTDDGEEE